MANSIDGPAVSILCSKITSDANCGIYVRYMYAPKEYDFVVVVHLAVGSATTELVRSIS